MQHRKLCFWNSLWWVVFYSKYLRSLWEYLGCLEHSGCYGCLEHKVLNTCVKTAHMNIMHRLFQKKPNKKTWKSPSTASLPCTQEGSEHTTSLPAKASQAQRREVSPHITGVWVLQHERLPTEHCTMCVRPLACQTAGRKRYSHIHRRDRLVVMDDWGSWCTVGQHRCRPHLQNR